MLSGPEVVQPGRRMEGVRAESTAGAGLKIFSSGIRTHRIDSPNPGRTGVFPVLGEPGNTRGINKKRITSLALQLLPVLWCPVSSMAMLELSLRVPFFLSSYPSGVLPWCRFSVLPCHPLPGLCTWRVNGAWNLSGDIIGVPCTSPPPLF